MTHDELLDTIGHWNWIEPEPLLKALRGVVELANKQLDITDMPAEQVGWFYEGYNLAMGNIIDVIEKELR